MPRDVRPRMRDGRAFLFVRHRSGRAAPGQSCRQSSDQERTLAGGPQGNVQGGDRGREKDTRLQRETFKGMLFAGRGEIWLGQTKSEAGGSNTTGTVGTAIHEVAQLLHSALAELAVKDSKSPLHNLSPNDIAMAAPGQLGSKSDHSKSDAYIDILKRAGRDSIEVET